MGHSDILLEYNYCIDQCRLGPESSMNVADRTKEMPMDLNIPSL